MREKGLLYMARDEHMEEGRTSVCRASFEQRRTGHGRLF